jgi:uncharacterized protein YeaO (DUF488 family)
VTSEPGSPRIVTGSVFDPPEAPYFRYLVSRRWPSGVERGAVDQWDRELAPSDDLLESWRSGAVDDETFEARYEAELEERPALLGWVVRTAEVNGIALVDDVGDGRAPREVLASIMERRIAAGESEDGR